MFLNKISRFLSYFGKGYEIKLVYLLFMGFMTSLLDFLSIVLIFPLIMILVNPGRVANNPVAMYIQNTFHISGTKNMIMAIGGLIAFIVIVKNIYSIIIQYSQGKMISQWALDIKEKMLGFFLYSPYEVDIQRGNNNIVNKITVDVDDVMQYYISKAILFISNSFVIVMVFSILIFLVPVFTIVAILFFTITGLAQDNMFKKWSQDLMAKKQNLLNGPYHNVVNNLTSVKDIKVTGCQKFFYDMYRDISEKMIPYIEKINIIPLIPQYILEIIFIFTMIIICFGILEQYGEDPANVLVSMGVLAIAVYRLVPQIYRNHLYMNYMNMYSERVDELFALYDEYSKFGYAKDKDSKEKLPFNDSIKINDLSYSYDKKEDVINNINLDIKKGEFIGIVGLSGAGKTTFVDCLLGLLDYQGEILIDNENINIDNVQKFRNIVGYVPQKITTLAGDIYANVAWGIPRKDIDKNLVDTVLKEAQLYDQLKQTENGLEIEIKQDGTGLSGGQMQRIGIARALYRQPEIIILDEATANLDVKIENKLTDIISNIKGKKTIIAIAHRLSTLISCDRIAYMKDGTIVDVGTFQELCIKYDDFNEIVRLSRIKLEEENE